MDGVARRDLKDELFELLPHRFRGYLLPQPNEEQGPNGERLLVYLLEDLAGALLDAIDTFPDGDFSFTPFDNTSERLERVDYVDDDKNRVQRRAVWLYLGVDQHPCGFEAAIDLATGRGEPVVTGPASKRRWMFDAFVQAFFYEPDDDKGLRPRPVSRRTVVPRRVELADLSVVNRWLRHAPTNGPGSMLFAAWQRDRGQDVSRMVLLFIALQVASSRFIRVDAKDPLEDWYARNAGNRHFRPDHPCRLCPSRAFGGASCACAARVMHIAAGSRRSGNASCSRTRNLVDVGQAAIEIAARALVTRHPREWPTRDHLTWVLGRYPITARAPDVEIPRGLAALGALLGDTVPDAKEIQLAAAFIDDTSDPGMLREVAELGRAAFARHADQHAAEERAFAELARTLAGAFRELRSPASATFQRQLAASDVARHPKALEALQDLQLAEQRLLHWALAAAGYELALDLLAERFPATGTQKRFEIEEQLHLGRLGGLILEAEQLLFTKRSSRAVRARIAALLDSAIALGGDGGQLQGALEQIVVHRTADNVSPKERDVLRYSDRWQVMPQIMLSRAYVTRAALGIVTRDRRREDDLERARGIHEVLAGRSDLTARQRWEIERVALVATAVAGEAADVPARVDSVRAAGGDDGGDYVELALRWLSGRESVMGTRLASLLREAAPALLVVDAAVPRLPDVETRRQ